MIHRVPFLLDQSRRRFGDFKDNPNEMFSACACSSAVHSDILAVMHMRRVGVCTTCVKCSPLKWKRGRFCATPIDAVRNTRSCRHAEFCFHYFCFFFPMSFRPEWVLARQIKSHESEQLLEKNRPISTLADLNVIWMNHLVRVRANVTSVNFQNMRARVSETKTFVSRVAKYALWNWDTAL